MKEGIIFEWKKPIIHAFTTFFKGKRYKTYSRLQPHESAMQTITSLQKTLLLFFGVFIISSLIWDWHTTVSTFIGVLITFYFIDILFNLFLLGRSLQNPPEVYISEEDIQARIEPWPTYTILCPLYKETKVLPQFISAMKDIDYPQDKLQIILLLEEDDPESIACTRYHPLPLNFKTIVIPDAQPKTKPKAINYGLQHVTSEYVVVFDAEDVPDSDQLKKAVLAFETSNERTICMQAKLHFYNAHQNLLTRLFAAEYFLWFDSKLTGLQSINAPIPLGGTSNHFKTHMLKEIQAWDAFNVTEDCDLGMRIAKRGYQTAIVDSITWEEANSNVFNWFRQRTRWIKGYMQTYLVHSRNPYRFIQESSLADFLTFQIIVGGKTFSMLLNPIMWIVTLSYFLFYDATALIIESFFPRPILYMGTFALLFGNFQYLYQYMIALMNNEQYDLIKYMLFVPFYWILMSASSFVALYEVIRKPYYWAKTHHGLHLPDETETDILAVARPAPISALPAV